MAANGYFRQNTDGTIDCIADKFIGALYALPANFYTGPVSISLSDSIAMLNDIGSTTSVTLAAGEDGQRMSIICYTFAGTADVAATFGGGITGIAFTAAGQGVDLVSSGSVWYVVGNNGATLS